MAEGHATGKPIGWMGWLMKTAENTVLNRYISCPIWPRVIKLRTYLHLLISIKFPKQTDKNQPLHFICKLHFYEKSQKKPNNNPFGTPYDKMSLGLPEGFKEAVRSLHLVYSSLHFKHW